MSIASRITEIETHIGDVYDTIDYSYDTTGVNKNIINIPKYLKKGYIDIINNGIDTLYNNFPKVSGIGSNLSLTPTYEAPMKLNEIHGDTLQDGTPTPDTPVPIQSVTGLQNVEVCGKNLLNIPNGTYSHNGITAVVNNGEITLNGTASATSFIVITLLKEIVAANQTLTISNNNQENISDNLTEARLLTTVGDYIPCSFKQINNSTTRTNLTGTYNRLQIRTSSGVSFNNFIIKPQLEKGSATTYEPYKGNTYEVNLGKNLCNNALFVASSGATINSYTDNSISVTFVGTYKAATQFIDISNSIYTFSIGNISNNKGRMEVYLYNNGEQVGTKQNVTANQTYIIDNTSGFGDQIRLTLSNSDLTQTNEITFDNIQLEKGSQATSYSPYFTPIELNKIENYQDSIKKSTGKNLINYNGTEISLIKSTNRTANVNFNNEPILEPGTYTLSLDNLIISNSNYGLLVRLSLNNTLESTIYTFTDKKVNFTLTERKTLNYIYVFLNGADNDNATAIFSKIQLEKGSTKSAYEPYGKVWYIEKNIGKVVLTGASNENWTQNSSQTQTNTNYFASNVIDNLLKSDEKNGVSNYFTVVNELWNTDIQGIQFSTSSSNIRLRINKTIASDLSTFKTWLSNNNTTIYYVLATPTYTEITNTELIEDLETLYTAKSQEGTTNISITSEDLEMILNVSALKGEV